MPAETEKLLADLKVWCNEARGRRAEVAKLIGSPRQTITNWFRGVQQPTGEQALIVLKFLQQQREKQ
jgi:DNA-binding transcriptional regulator YiaG